MVVGGSSSVVGGLLSVVGGSPSVVVGGSPSVVVGGSTSMAVGGSRLRLRVGVVGVLEVDDASESESEMTSVRRGTTTLRCRRLDFVFLHSASDIVQLRK